jgi:hypothetical protein
MADVLQAAGSRSSTRRARGPVLRHAVLEQGVPEAAARCASRRRRPCGRRPRRDGIPSSPTPRPARARSASWHGRIAARRAHAAHPDFSTFWARDVLPGLDGRFRRPGRAVLHPTCTLVKRGGAARPRSPSRARTAEEVVVPPGAECCGFAGDRGFVVPELTRRRRCGRRRKSGPRTAAPHRPLLDLPHLRDRHVARVGRPIVDRPPRARGPARWLSRFLRMGRPSCRRAVYAVLMALSALENIFPPVPADIAVVLGASWPQGIVSAPLLGFLCWLGNTASAAACISTRAHGRASSRRLAAEADAAGAIAALEKAYARTACYGSSSAGSCPGAGGGDAVRGHRRDEARARPHPVRPPPPPSGTRSRHRPGSVLAQAGRAPRPSCADANRAPRDRGPHVMALWSPSVWRRAAGARRPNEERHAAV